MASASAMAWPGWDGGGGGGAGGRLDGRDGGGGAGDGRSLELPEASRAPPVRSAVGPRKSWSSSSVPRLCSWSDEPGCDSLALRRRSACLRASRYPGILSSVPGMATGGRSTGGFPGCLFDFRATFHVSARRGGPVGPPLPVHGQTLLSQVAARRALQVWRAGPREVGGWPANRPSEPVLAAHRVGARDRRAAELPRTCSMVRRGAGSEAARSRGVGRRPGARSGNTDQDDCWDPPASCACHLHGVAPSD